MKLTVGKEYNLNNIKQISVTDDFLTLDEEVTKCQNKESYMDCTTKVYIDTLLKDCQCLPLAIRQQYNQVLIELSSLHCSATEFLDLRKYV